MTAAAWGYLLGLWVMALGLTIARPKHWESVFLFMAVVSVAVVFFSLVTG